MKLDDFIIRCVVVTLCIWFLLYNFYPQYEFIDSTHRVNKVSGKSEYYSTGSIDRGWNTY